MNPPEPSFAAPWQAQAFALAVALNEAGRLDWGEWTRAFGAARAGEGDYFADWLATLERLLAARGIATPEEVQALAAAWERAAAATPHGQPISLDNDPEARRRSASAAAERSRSSDPKVLR